jgi:hypothetical protein
MLTKWKSNKSRTRTTVTQLYPGRRKVLGTIRPLGSRDPNAKPVFMAARPLTAAQLDTVQVIMAE